MLWITVPRTRSLEQKEKSLVYHFYFSLFFSFFTFCVFVDFPFSHRVSFFFVVVSLHLNYVSPKLWNLT